MPEFTPLQEKLFEIITEEIEKDLVEGQCKLSDAEFIGKIVEKRLKAPHKNSIGVAIDKLVAKKRIEKVTTSLPGSTGRVRTITFPKK